MRAYLGLGSNIGDRQRNIEKSLDLLQRKAIPFRAVSKLYETEPWGFFCDDVFLNCVAEVETDLNPSELLAVCKTIEKKMGRVQKKTHQYESRPIDIDILFYGNQIFNTDELTIPHPLIQERLFVLQPFCDIAPDFIHPQLHERMDVLLEKCPDKNWVKSV